MHIAISANALSGLGGSALLCDFNTFVRRQEEVLDSFKTARKKTNQIHGGVEKLSQPVSHLNSRIQREERRLQAVSDVRDSVNSFLDLADQVDRQVASIVRKNRAWFFHTTDLNKKKESLISSVWGWLKNICTDTVDWVKDLGKSIANFYRENKKEIWGTVVIVALAALAIVGIGAAAAAGLAAVLAALSVPAATAAAIASWVATAAVCTTVMSAMLDIADLWFDIDHPVFNSVQMLSAAASTLLTAVIDVTAIGVALSKAAVKGFGAVFKGIKNFADNAIPKVKQTMNREFWAGMLNEKIVGVKQYFSMKEFRNIFKLNNLDASTYKKIAGNFGEMVQDAFMKMLGYKRLHELPVSTLDDAIHHGIDGIYYKIKKGDIKFVISEAKFNTANLSTDVRNLKQMSGNWIADRLGSTKLKAIWYNGKEYSGKVLEKLILDKGYISQLVNVLPDGKIKVSYLDDLAKKIPNMKNILIDNAPGKSVKFSRKVLNGEIGQKIMEVSQGFAVDSVNYRAFYGNILTRGADTLRYIQNFNFQSPIVKDLYIPVIRLSEYKWPDYGE